MTTPGSAVGTVAYMSPEQARAEPVDGRSDLFSLGLVLYESVAGRHPFRATSAAAIIAGLQTQDAPPLVRFRSDAPDELQRIVTKLLRRSADERYQSAGDVATDLRALSRALASGSADSTTVSVVAAHRRRVWGCGVACRSRRARSDRRGRCRRCRFRRRARVERAARRAAHHRRPAHRSIHSPSCRWPTAFQARIRNTSPTASPRV